MRFPHVQGLFRERVVVPAAQAVAVTCDLSQAALMEPFAVALHAVGRAPALVGADVLVSGAGPIGCLVAAAAMLAGAASVTITDIAQAPLTIARTVGADVTLDARDGAALAERADTFAVAFDCSGAAAALTAAFAMLRPGGVLVAVGLGAEPPPPLPLSRLVTREIEVRGSVRFDGEFALAAALISSGRVDLSTLVTARRPLAQASDAFGLAGDRAAAMKAQIALDA